MRGVGDRLTVGERVAFYRRRRGLTQAVLAGLVGRSEDWLSKVERGEREIRRVDVLADMARALRVSLGDLLGQPVLTNVELHRLSTALDLGDVAAVVEHGPEIRAANMPVERRVSHQIDVARALHLTARDDDALTMLLAAEREAPSLVRHNPAVRETVKTMARRAPATSGRSSALLSLAVRCRAVQ
jgi:transcriptional regulator with XRE-family HTH domain